MCDTKMDYKKSINDIGSIVTKQDAKIRKMLLSCGAERERVVKEMQYRLKCLLAVDVLELEHSSAIWGTFQKAVKAASCPVAV